MQDGLYIYIAVFLLTFIFTVLIARMIIPILSKKAEQPIYEDGPRWHMSKAGTPTMGGIAFLISVTLILLFCSLLMYLNQRRYESLSLISVIVYAVLNSVIGIIDDLTKLKKHKNKGLTPTQKLIFQFLAAGLFLLVRAYVSSGNPDTSLSIFGIDITLLYYPLMTIILVGITNCANLTDGIDGLASSVAFAAGIAMFFISYTVYDEAAFICSSVIGAACAFLIFNIHPARIFMGDTGSLFLGSILAATAIAMKIPLLVILICGVYVIEGISVIIQVTVYKLTKKRVFKMAPLHHHLEKLGWGENKICISAIILTLILSLVAYIISIQ